MNKTNKTAYFLAASITLMATAPTAYAAGQIYVKLGGNSSSSSSFDVDEISDKFSELGDKFSELFESESSDESSDESSNDRLTARFDADSSLMPASALGYDFGNGFAMEYNSQESAAVVDAFVVDSTLYNDPLEIPNTAGGNLIFTSTMFKIIYGKQRNSNVVLNPYIGFGFGTTNIHSDKDGGYLVEAPLDNSASSFQLTLGNRFQFSQSWFGDIAVNYINIDATTLTYASGNFVPERVSSSSMVSISYALGWSF